jgi:predicted fused transcriptional regulator/phosphomethylpyrimidine kinase
MIKVIGKEVLSTLVVIGLDITIEKDGNEYDLTLNVRYDEACAMGYTDITWDVTNGDESILEQDDIQNQLDDFVQEYVLENIGKF